MNKLLLEAPVGRLFARYLFPTVCATLVTAIYLFADTVMVGYRLGAEGVAALNLIVPLEFAFFAVGSLLGNGGGICFTRRLSVGDVQGARRCFAVSVTAGVCFAAVAMAVCLVFLRPLVGRVLGAGEGAFLDAAVSYGLPIAAGCPAFVAVTLLAPFLRHDRAPRRAMAAVLAGGLTNIALDWLFLYPLNLGLFGAGLATTCGATLTTAILLTHFRTPDRALRWARPDWRLLSRVAWFGGGDFLQELTGSATVMLFNRLALGTLGEPGLAIYGVVANYLLTMTAVFNGVAQAAHPLTAANAAAGKPRRVRSILWLALGTAEAFGLAAMAVAVGAPTLCLRAFLPADELAALPGQASGALAVALLCLPLMGAAQIATLQLPAVGRPARGTCFACLRSGALLFPIGLGLGAFAGPWSIWWAFVLAEAAVLPGLLWSLSDFLRGNPKDGGRGVQIAEQDGARAERALVADALAGHDLRAGVEGDVMAKAGITADEGRGVHPQKVSRHDIVPQHRARLHKEKVTDPRVRPDIGKGREHRTQPERGVKHLGLRVDK